MNRIGNIAYELDLLRELASLHHVFHVSMLKKCVGDPSLIIPKESDGVKTSYQMKKFWLRFWIVRFVS